MDIKNNMRTLQSGRKVDEEIVEKKLTIASKCPKKWLFVDLETGDVWKWYKPEDRWMHITKKEKKELQNLSIRCTM